MTTPHNLPPPPNYEGGPTTSRVPNDVFFNAFTQATPQPYPVYPVYSMPYPTCYPLPWYGYPPSGTPPAPSSTNRTPPQRKRTHKTKGLTPEEQARAAELGISAECAYQVLQAARSALRIPVALGGNRTYALLIFYFPSGHSVPLGLTAIAIQTDGVDGYTIVQAPYATAVDWLSRLPNVKISSICLT